MHARSVCLAVWGSKDGSRTILSPLRVEPVARHSDAETRRETTRKGQVRPIAQGRLRPKLDHRVWAHLRLDLRDASRFAGRVSDIPLNRRVQWIALRPDAIRSDLVQQLREAREYGCQVVCVSGSRVELAVECLDESDVKVAALIGFPFGSGDGDVKRYETEVAVDAGAQEIHCVINLGWLKEGLDARILRELRDVREAAEERPVTAILEMGILTPEEAIRAAQVTMEAECQFLATATGCAVRPTSVEDVQLLREAAGEALGITAVGGVYGPDEAEGLIRAGANRVGVFALGKLRS